MIRSDTSDIEKNQVKVMTEFYRLIQKASDYTCAILLTPRNLPHLQNFMDLLFFESREGINKVAQKVVCGILKKMQT